MLHIPSLVALLLVTLIAQPICKAQNQSPIQPAWHGDLPTIEHLFQSTLSIWEGGGLGGNTCILLAKPQPNGSYLVRIETIGPIDGVDAPSNVTEQTKYHSIVTYHIAPARINQLRKQLANIDISKLPEYESLNVTDVGMHVACFDLSDGKRFVVGGTNSLENASPQHAAFSKAIRQCFQTNVSLSRPNAPHLLNFKHQLVIDDSPEASSESPRLTIVTPVPLTRQSQPPMPGMLVYQAVTTQFNQRAIPIDVVEDLLKGTSKFLATHAMINCLGHPADCKNPAKIRKLVEHVEHWQTSGLDVYQRWLQSPAQTALTYLAQKHDPQTYDLLMKFAQSEHFIKTSHAKRNILRQNAIGLLRNYWEQHPKPIQDFWIQSLEHEDPYVVLISGKCLAQMQITLAVDSIVKQAQKISDTMAFDLWLSALTLGYRPAAKPVTQYLNTISNHTTQPYYIGLVSERLGIAITQDDLKNELADLPIENANAMFELAIQRLKQLPHDQMTTTLKHAMDAMAYRWYNKPHAREQLLIIKNTLTNDTPLMSHFNKTIRTIDEQNRRQFGAW